MAAHPYKVEPSPALLTDIADTSRNTALNLAAYIRITHTGGPILRYHGKTPVLVTRITEYLANLLEALASSMSTSNALAGNFYGIGGAPVYIPATMDDMNCLLRANLENSHVIPVGNLDTAAAIANIVFVFIEYINAATPEGAMVLTVLDITINNLMAGFIRRNPALTNKAHTHHIAAVYATAKFLNTLYGHCHLPLKHENPYLSADLQYIWHAIAHPDTYYHTHISKS